MNPKLKAIKLDQEKISAYLPRLVQLVVFLLFLFLSFIPTGNKIRGLYSQISEKESALVLRERGYQDASKLKEELASLEKEAATFDKRFPNLIETNMLIDSLKTITKEARLKFISIEPKAQVKFELPSTRDLYYELPIRIQLQCGFFELVDFIKKLENSKSLMKITSLSIKSNPRSDWDHDVELVISNFARGNPKAGQGEKKIGN